jgi:putative ABC transport system permease protein
VIGICVGTLIAWVLITVLRGVFDPPPDVIAMPWGYLALTITAAFAATVAAAEIARRDAISMPITTITETGEAS